jgi:hypothetical protein
LIEASQIEEILALYKKYGWTLRRVLLTDTLKTKISDRLNDLFGAEAAFVSAEMDAVWLSRNSITGSETWELRHLSSVPFALVEVFDEEDDEIVREERLHEIETELKEKLGSKKSPEKSH